MKIKKYVVKSIDEAISQIKKDLGEDAYIVSQQKIRKKGKLNLASVDWIEVTAAVDQVKLKDTDLSSSLLAKKYGQSRQNPDPTASIAQSIAEKESRGQGAFNEMIKFKTELLPIKKEVEEIKLLLRQAGMGFDPIVENFRGVYLEFYLNLIENGVEKEIAKKLVYAVKSQIGEEKPDDKQAVKNKLFNIVLSLIAPPAPLNLTNGQRKIVVMVGPTGVGKTTTIAKLGAYFKLMENKKVAFVTVDNYKIGSEAHLRTYSDIIDVPFYSLYQNQLGRKLEEMKDFDLIFVDTTGRSAKDSEGLEVMRAILAEIPEAEKEVFLLLSASTKSQDLYHIYRSFSVFEPDKLILAKIDETISLGNLFNIKVKTEIPAAYFTTGQRVPEDIEIAYARKFARMVLNETNHGEQS